MTHRHPNWTKARDKYPLRPEVMLRACRKLARDYRYLGCPEAAASLDAQGDRWEREMTEGVCNRESRIRLGERVW